MRNSTVPVRINHLTHMICIYLNCVAVVAYKCKKHTFLQVKTIWCKPKARKTYLCDFGKRHSTWWHEVMNSFSMLMLRNYAKWWPSNQFGLTYLILQKHIQKKNNNRTYHSKVDIYVAMFEAQCLPVPAFDHCRLFYHFTIEWQSHSIIISKQTSSDDCTRYTNMCC